MACLLLLALAVVLATLIPQIPTEARDDPETWLAVQSGLSVPGNRLVRSLRLYDLYHTLGFRLLLALIGLALFVWTAESVELAWRASRRRPWPPAAITLWGRHNPPIRIPSSQAPEGVEEKVRAFLTERGFQPTPVSDFETPNLVAVRRQLSLWAQPIASGALLLALAGLVVLSTWGWQGETWQPAPGERRAVGHRRNQVVQLDAYGHPTSAEGPLCEYQSQITWLVDGEPIEQDTVAVGQPSTLAGLAARQVGYAPEVALEGRDKAGNPVTLQPGGRDSGAQGQVKVLFPTPDAQPLVLIPGRDLFLTLSFDPRVQEGSPAINATLVRNGGAESQPLGAVQDGSLLAVDGLEIAVGLSYRPLLRVDHRPAVPLVLAGVALALAALAWRWFLPPRLAWISVAAGREHSTVLHLVAPAGAGHDRWLSTFAAELREVIADGD